MLRLASALLLVACAGCGTVRPTDGPAPADLVGPTWRLVALGDEAVPADADITLTFTPDGRVAGSSGCNQYSGDAALGAGGALAVTEVVSTLRACPPPAGARERALFDALRQADRAAVVDGELWVRGGMPLRFVAAPGGGATLRGTVTYLPRVALAPDAVVTVRLLDVSLADAPSETLAEQTIRPDGQQVPLPFALSYDPARVEARRRYVVRAEIHDADGALRWTTDTAFPVLTQGAPTDGVEVRVVQGAGDAAGMAP